MKKLMLLLIPVLVLTGCTSADTVSTNISREADEFKVRRRITFINLRSNEYLFSITGNCSIKGGSEDYNNELEERIQKLERQIKNIDTRIQKLESETTTQEENFYML